MGAKNALHLKKRPVLGFHVSGIALRLWSRFVTHKKDRWVKIFLFWFLRKVWYSSLLRAITYEYSIISWYDVYDRNVLLLYLAEVFVIARILLDEIFLPSEILISVNIDYIWSKVR